MDSGRRKIEFAEIVLEKEDRTTIIVLFVLLT
jgi:hypothetical protein